MAETSAISWTKSTFNPWIGCTKVGPGCDHCYAAVSTPARAMGIKWGPGEQRHRTSASNWAQPLKWNKQAPESTFAGRKGFWPVFCASLADVFDNEVPDEWRRDLFALIRETPNLTWLLVTKRIGNVKTMLPPEGLPPNVWLLITVVNQEEANRDIPKLVKISATKIGVSYEPALGPVDWLEACSCQYCGGDGYHSHGPDDFACGECDGHVATPDEIEVDWIIVGGESDQGAAKARPFVLGWGKNTVRQCQAAGVAVFVKQLGSNPTNREGERHPQIERAGKDMAEWPEILRVQEFPCEVMT